MKQLRMKLLLQNNNACRICPGVMVVFLFSGQQGFTGLVGVFSVFHHFLWFSTAGHNPFRPNYQKTGRPASFGFDKVGITDPSAWFWFSNDKGLVPTKQSNSWVKNKNFNHKTTCSNCCNIYKMFYLIAFKSIKYSNKTFRVQGWFEI